MNNSSHDNNSFDNNLNTGFELAYELCIKEYTHKELLQMLDYGNIPEKQIAALKFDKVDCIEDAQALLNNLTGCDGKIREAVAHKINQLLITNYKTHKYFSKISAKIFANATIDINGNICRLITNSSALLKENNYFAKGYTEIIIQETLNSLNELDKFIFRDKKYVINKQLFKLYWCLETLCNFYEFVPQEILYRVIEKSASQQEYTIREKTAQLLKKSGLFPSIADKLKHDSNYYVRQTF